MEVVLDIDGCWFTIDTDRDKKDNLLELVSSFEADLNTGLVPLPCQDECQDRCRALAKAFEEYARKRGLIINVRDIVYGRIETRKGIHILLHLPILRTRSDIQIETRIDERRVPHRYICMALSCLTLEVLEDALKMMREGRLPVYVNVSQEVIRLYKKKPAKRIFASTIKYVTDYTEEDEAIVHKRIIEETIRLRRYNCQELWMILVPLSLL